jgi:phosphotransferase system enzyme I (PtsI)
MRRPADLLGQGIGTGVVVAAVAHLGSPLPVPDATVSDQPAAERLREALDALAATAAELREHHSDTAEAREILQTNAMMAADPSIATDVHRRIECGATPERAIYDTFNHFRDLLRQAGGVVAGRTTDVEDIRDRTIARVMGVVWRKLEDADHPVVVVAADLSPADTARLDPRRVAALITEQGGPTSHTAIVARAMGIPAIVACPRATSIAEGAVIALDVERGAVWTDVSPAEQQSLSARASTRAHEARTDRRSATADGHLVPLLANIGHLDDIDIALEQGAEGIGLFRTEFLFLNRETVPSIAEQTAAYKVALEAFPRRPVTFRVLDVGADKPLPFLNEHAEGEPNPALGERGIRLWHRHRELFEGQLAAIACAVVSAAAVDVGVMAPMISDAEETRLFATRCRAAGLHRVGVMVEVPAAALRAADHTAHVEFFSIGTNDLTQYAVAADRQLGALAALNDPWHPAVLDLVALTASAATATGRSCGVCGEAAGDPLLACVLIGLGVNTLSMSPRSIPAVKAALERTTLQQCQIAASLARESSSAAAARHAANACLTLKKSR